MPRRVAIVGGGIAGLAAAWALSRRGVEVELLEREPLLGAQSTGRSAAIFRCLDLTPGGAELAVRSAPLLDALLGERSRWLSADGVLYLSRGAEKLEPLARLAREHRLDHTLLTGAALAQHVPSLEGGDATHGLLCRDEGVIDVHAVMEALSRAARANGALLRTGVAVERLTAQGLLLTDGTELGADAVVLAAGASAGPLGVAVGAGLPLSPKGRHLALLDTPAPIGRGGPVVWRLDDELYFRPESGGVLASPCDEVAEDAQVTSNGLELLATKLRQSAPPLASSCVRRAWVGQRTFAPDRGMVIGPDPRRAGLFWLVGLGGHGISAGVAAAELLAKRMFGETDQLEKVLGVERLTE